MSHFTKIATRMSDRDCLVLALADCGYKTVEVHDRPEALYGYTGDVRPQRAEVIVRRRFVGILSNDIGFSRAADGTLEAMISQFDARKHGDRWLGKLTQRYAYHATTRQLESQGFQLVTERVASDSSVHLVLRRF